MNLLLALLCSEVENTALDQKRNDTSVPTRLLPHVLTPGSCLILTFASRMLRHLALNRAASFLSGLD